MAENREIFDTFYTPESLEPSRTTGWDAQMEDLRRRLLATYSRGDVLDLCCGTGAFFDAVDGRSRSLVGIDFSRSLLAAGRARSSPTLHPLLVEADAHASPFRAASFDTVYSYSSLYVIPRLDLVVDEVRRVLRPDGIAILDLGNRRSLMTALARAHHEQSGWAAHHTVTTRELRRLVERIGQVVEWRSFQVLPMLRRPPGALRAIAPLTHPGWKYVLGNTIRGRTLDELVSSTRLLRGLAFRHVVVVRRS